MQISIVYIRSDFGSDYYESLNVNLRLVLLTKVSKWNSDA